MNKATVRRILITTKDFKSFWKKHGPFKYALTSAEFPPILLEPEEWIFSDNIILLLKELMQWDLRKMAIIEAPFNKESKQIFKPEELLPWRVDNFPQEWEFAVCETFTPLGYLTEAVNKIALSYLASENICSKTVESNTARRVCRYNLDIFNIETAFFKSLEENISKIGYVLLKPEPSIDSADVAYISSYLEEWKADEEEL